MADLLDKGDEILNWMYQKYPNESIPREVVEREIKMEGVNLDECVIYLHSKEYINLYREGTGHFVMSITPDGLKKAKESSLVLSGNTQYFSFQDKANKIISVLVQAFEFSLLNGAKELARENKRTIVEPIDIILSFDSAIEKLKKAKEMLDKDRDKSKDLEHIRLTFQNMFK
ncbi:MAG: hypothetical protein WC614_07155 [bacterium]